MAFPKAFDNRAKRPKSAGVVYIPKGIYYNDGEPWKKKT
jgi:hypothetical protein